MISTKEIMKQSFEFSKEIGDSYNKVKRVYAKNNDSNTEIFIDLHEIVADAIIDKKLFEIIISNNFLDGDCVLNGIVLSDDTISFHGLIFSSSEKIPGINPDDNIYFSINIL
jgi:ferritin